MDTPPLTKLILAIAALTALAGCARTPPNPILRANPGESTHVLATAPTAAAECVARNAADPSANRISRIQPLYGLDRLAVIVETGPAGGTPLAVAYVGAAYSGSRVTIATTNFVTKRSDLVQQLLKGCG